MLLVDDRIDADRGFSGGSIADDQLALPASDREQCVDYENAGIHRLGHEIALDDCGGRALDRHLRFGFDRLVTIERPPERIDDTAEQPRPDRDAHDLAGPGHPRAGLDGFAIVEQNSADRLGIEGQRKPHAPAVKAQCLVEAGIGQARDQGNSVANALDAAHRVGLWREVDFCDSRAAARQPRVVDRVRQRLCHDEPAPI